MKKKCNSKEYPIDIQGTVIIMDNDTMTKETIEDCNIVLTPDSILILKDESLRNIDYRYVKFSTSTLYAFIIIIERR